MFPAFVFEQLDFSLPLKIENLVEDFAESLSFWTAELTAFLGTIGSGREGCDLLGGAVCDLLLGIELISSDLYLFVISSSNTLMEILLFDSS